MSWIERVKDKMVITTGDGVDHFPEWLNASFVVEYNHTEFNFVGVEGGLVKRKKAIGTKYNLEIVFQGADHLIDADNFRRSSDGSEEPWIIQHPLYGSLVVQPTTLNYDNTGQNVSRITGVVIETMEEPPRNNYADPMDMIPALTEESTELAVENLTVTPVPGDVTTMAQNNATAYKKGVPIITDALDFEEFHNAFNTANTYIDSLTATPLLAMRSLIEVIQLPGKFVAGVQQRIKVLVDTFNSLRNNILGLFNVSSKEIYTAQQCSLVAAVCSAASTPLAGNYTKSSTVFEVIEQISTMYAQLVEDLDSLQSTNAGAPQSFVANAELLIKVNQLVNITITNLFTIALGAQQERSIICEKDTNAITLTHLVYGLDKADVNLNRLIDNNELSLEELLRISKGRKIVYYV